ncbi:integrase core domain-containing protein [Bythopirellula goksoeyrii]|uniref:Integrase core domain protein n=1 Tax=Bythopirellula goksoeyrii TaxID=1400387 RepID=A0A5B9QBI3_9BACT|nr:integrase core domain-containing protein [Bythopirellula goksoeyrii]QEG35139.1 Integrase core domain protein [Bythopirellula goksoeyrii]
MVHLNVATRNVWISPSTAKPTPEWVKEQSKAILAYASREDLSVDLVTRDRDNLYRKVFDETCTKQGVRVKTLSYRSPVLNAYVERFIQSIQVECLDHFLIFGEPHLDYLVREYVEHYHWERPHQGLDNRLISGQPLP